MLIKISYNEESKSLVNEIIENYPNLPIEAFNEDTLKGKKGAWALKGSWAARENPFAIVFNDKDEVIKAFYAEANECTFANINNVLMTYE